MRRAMVPTMIGLVLVVAGCGGPAKTVQKHNGTTTTSRPTTTTAASSTTVTSAPSTSTTTTEAATSSTTTTAAVLPVLPACGSGGPTPPLSRPTTVLITCGDGSIAETGITWSTWNDTYALGEGTANVNSCQPDCATGKVDTYPASIYVFGVVKGASPPVFQDVTVTPTGSSGQVQSSYMPGGWGVQHTAP